MHSIRLNYTLVRDGGSPLIRNPLIDLLQAVNESGSISGAARTLDLSYRHVWGELKRWEIELGQQLVTWEKGQPARLTEFASKLMWAERQAQARLAPQIEALRADLDRAFAVAFDDQAHILTLYASHDHALVALGDLARRRRLHLDIRYGGSVDAIRALNEGRCSMAGFHTQIGVAAGSLAQRTYKPLLKPGQHKLIRFARRVQGLIVAPDNPLGLQSLADLHRRHARFANRARGSGTRVVFEDLLQANGLRPSDIRGYDSEEPSHAAVAAAVASGAADAGLGIEASARARGLDFVPLIEEHYHLACLKSSLDQPATQALLAVLHSHDWHSKLSTLPGYTATECGIIQAMSKVLPWWQFRGGKAHPPKAPVALTDAA